MRTPPQEAEPQGPDPASGNGPWVTVAAWRKSERARLLAERQAVPGRLRQRMAPLILDSLETHVPNLRDAAIGLYWPIRAEIDLRRLTDSCAGTDAIFALPVVIEKRAPLEFHRWRPGDRLTRGVWNIPVPATRELVTPDVLLVPLLGHDDAGYRLGYGGGYYDRTLAAMNPRPQAIGIGYAHARIETIQPQPHDIPMDAIITEQGITHFDRSTGRDDQNTERRISDEH